jgi:hypothetical protein
MTDYRISAAKTVARWEAREAEERRNKQAEDKAAASLWQVPSPAAKAIPEHHLVVARLCDEAMKNPKLKEILAPLKSAINTPLPLVEAPPLHDVLKTLYTNFPALQT